MEKPIRSLTLPQGLKDSSFAITSPLHPWVTRFNLNKGVRPINSEMKLAIRAIAYPLFKNPKSLPSFRKPGISPAFVPQGGATRRQVLRI
jgi:hypothetical protein